MAIDTSLGIISQIGMCPQQIEEIESQPDYAAAQCLEHHLLRIGQAKNTE